MFRFCSSLVYRLGASVFSPRELSLSSVWASPSAQSIGLSPGQWWWVEIPLPSTSSPGAHVPGVNTTNSEGTAQLSAVTSSTQTLGWSQLWPERREIKRQILFLSTHFLWWRQNENPNQGRAKQSRAATYKLFSKWGLTCRLPSLELDSQKWSCFLFSDG